MNDQDEQAHQVHAVELGELNVHEPSAHALPWAKSGAEALSSLPVEVIVSVGQCRMSAREVMALVRGQTLVLDKAVNAPVDLLVGGRIVAQGELVVIDEAFGVRVVQVRPDA